MFRRPLPPAARPRPPHAPAPAPAVRRPPPPPAARPRPSDAPGLVYDEGIEEDGIILSGTTRVPATGETYAVKNGYLDLLQGRLGGDNVATLTNFLPGAGRGYEPLWRVRSLDLLTGEEFPNEHEVGIIVEKVGLE